MNITSVKNINPCSMYFQQNNCVSDRKTNGLSSDKFVSSVAFGTNARTMKLPVENFDALFEQTLNLIRQTPEAEKKVKLLLDLSEEKIKPFLNELSIYFHKNHPEGLPHFDLRHYFNNQMAHIVYGKRTPIAIDEYAEHIFSNFSKRYKDLQKIIDMNILGKNTGEIFDSAVEEISKSAKSKNIKINVITDNNELKTTYINKSELYLIFHNVLSKAVESTPQNGKIEAKLTSVVENNGQYLKFITKDNGIGASQSDKEIQMDRLESKIVNNKDVGLGPNLDEVKKKILYTCGDIEVKSPAIDNPVNPEFPGTEITCMIPCKD